MTETAQIKERPVSAQQTLGLFTGQAILFSILGAALWVYSGRPLTGFLVWDAQHAASGVLLGLTLAALAWAAYRHFPHFSERMVWMHKNNFSFLDGSFSMFGIILLSLCAGIGEEALFRGGLQTLLSDYLGPHAAIIVASAVFAVIHWIKPVVTALIFVIGLLFGYIYWLTGSLLIVIIGHIVYDIFAIRTLQRKFRELGVLEPSGGASINLCVPETSDTSSNRNSNKGTD